MKGERGYTVGEKTDNSLFADDMVFCIASPNASIKQLWYLIHKFRKVTVYNLIIQISSTFLYIIMKQLDCFQFF